MTVSILQATSKGIECDEAFPKRLFEKTINRTEQCNPGRYPVNPPTKSPLSLYVDFQK
jgi:hypothetical protein